MILVQCPVREWPSTLKRILFRWRLGTATTSVPIQPYLLIRANSLVSSNVYTDASICGCCSRWKLSVSGVIALLRHYAILPFGAHAPHHLALLRQGRNRDLALNGFVIPVSMTPFDQRLFEILPANRGQRRRHGDSGN